MNARAGSRTEPRCSVVAVAITITKVGDRYSAEVTPPHGGGVPWQSATPMHANALVAELVSHGCHQTDIGDAFSEADPDWLDRRQ